MRYRALGKTGLSVSEIGLGAEWLERHNAEEVKAVIDRCEEHGVNILDCWMPEPNVRDVYKRQTWALESTTSRRARVRRTLSGHKQRGHAEKRAGRDV